MKRSIGLALVAALALAIGGGATASAAAADGAPQAAAKKGKKKAAKCKTAKKKGKGGKANAAAAAKKGKKKAAKCKTGKKKGKAKPKGKGKARPKPKAMPTGLTDGEYSDAGKSVTVTIGGGVTQARIAAPSGKCGGNLLLGVEGPIAQQGSEVKGSRTDSVFGGAGSVQWSLTITPATLAYRFDAVWAVNFPDQKPCQDTVSFQGTLSR